MKKLPKYWYLSILEYNVQQSEKYETVAKVRRRCPGLILITLTEAGKLGASLMLRNQEAGYPNDPGGRLPVGYNFDNWATARDKFREKMRHC